MFLRRESVLVIYCQGAKLLKSHHKKCLSFVKVPMFVLAAVELVYHKSQGVWTLSDCHISTSLKIRTVLNSWESIGVQCKSA